MKPGIQPIAALIATSLIFAGSACMIGTIAVKSRLVSGVVEFEFSTGFFCPKPTSPTNVTVFEVDKGHRGRSVCKMSRIGQPERVDLKRWQYGSTVAGFKLEYCEPLKERQYGLAATEPGAVGAIIFRVVNDRVEFSP